jgi:nitroreductase
VPAADDDRTISSVCALAPERSRSRNANWGMEHRLLRLNNRARPRGGTATRLDRLERDVDDQIILDCIDVAEQAPTSGGNVSSRRWMVIRDPNLKQGLADIYRAGAGRWVVPTPPNGCRYGQGAEHAGVCGIPRRAPRPEVPAIVIPTSSGADGGGRPGPLRLGHPGQVEHLRRAPRRGLGDVGHRSTRATACSEGSSQRVT